MLSRHLFHRSSGASSNLLVSRDVRARLWLSGIVLGAVTLLSLVQDVYRLDLGSITAYAVAVLGSVHRGLGILAEIFIIYLLIGLTLVRSLYQAISDINLDFSQSKSTAYKAKDTLILFSNMLLLGLIWPFLFAAVLYHKLLGSGEDYGILTSLVSRSMRILAVLLLILAANAFFSV